MPNIAIIGTQGAGKTVLITTLAHHLSESDGEGLSLKPQNTRTFKYVEKNWHILNNREWPSHTAAGNSFDLRWDLELSTSERHIGGEMRFVDASGHDLRLIFAEEDELTPDALPDKLQQVAGYCRTADIVVFAVNLKDYIAKPGSCDHIDNQAILMSAMGFVQSGHAEYCIVFTKADQYRDHALQIGGWDAVAKKHLKSIYQSHVVEEEIMIFPVAAVSQVEMVIDHGKHRDVPVPGFKPQGLEPFVEWLTESIELIEGLKKDDKVGGEDPVLPHASDSLPPPEKGAIRLITTPAKWAFYSGLVVFIFLFDKRTGNMSFDDSWPLALIAAVVVGFISFIVNCIVFAVKGALK